MDRITFGGMKLTLRDLEGKVIVQSDDLEIKGIPEMDRLCRQYLDDCDCICADYLKAFIPSCQSESVTKNILNSTNRSQSIEREPS